MSQPASTAAPSPANSPPALRKTVFSIDDRQHPPRRRGLARGTGRALAVLLPRPPAAALVAVPVARFLEPPLDGGREEIPRLAAALPLERPLGVAHQIVPALPLVGLEPVLLQERARLRVLVGGLEEDACLRKQFLFES